MISLARYADVLRQPDVGRAIAASLVGRLPIGVAGLAILLLVRAQGASYVDAGVVAAAYIAGLAIASPFLGRLIDRVGPRLVLLANAILYPAWMIALVWAERAQAPFAVAVLTSMLAGAALPPITTCMRTLLRQRLREEGQLAAALSLDSVIIEVVFIAGPMMVALFVALIAPFAAVLFAALCATLGALLFLRSPAVAAWRVEARAQDAPSVPLATSSFRRLLGVAVGYAVVFGLIEIGVTAHASAQGRPAFAGVLLGVMSVGSALGGLIYGSRSWHVPLARQFAIALLLMGAGIAPLAFLADPLLFTAFSLVAGVAMAAPLIIQSMTIATTVEPTRMAEAFTWATTALLCGVGIGLALGGLLLEHAAASLVFGVAATVAIAIGFAVTALEGNDAEQADAVAK